MLIKSSRSDSPSRNARIEMPPRPAPRLLPARRPYMAQRIGKPIAGDARHHPHDTATADGTHQTVEIFPSDVVRRRILMWRGMTAESIQFAAQSRTRFHFRAPRHLLVAYEEGERRDGDTFVEGLPRSTLRHFARKLTFVPANNEFSEWHEPGTPTRLMFVYFDEQNPHANCDPGLANASFPPRLFFEDPTLWSTVLKLKRSLEGQAQIDQPYAEALGVVLLHELVHLNSGIRHSNPPTRGGLAPWQQRTVASYIDEHLGEPITLATLAQLVRLSPHHFCRAFKTSFGVPPLRYHKSCRIERAKALLVKHGSSVTDAGLTIGFNETSAFSTAFRKETGLTPTEYRRAFA
jgi:AraC family transcriptional regulator